MHRPRLWSALVVAVVLLFAAAPRVSVAQTALPINAFYWTWEGVGVAENSDSLYFGVSTRDLNVQISATGSGFEVFWTTLVRGGGTVDNPDTRRREARLIFTSTDDPEIYEAEGSENPITGGVLSWARLHGQTLSIYQMTLNDRGGYELTSYDRTLTGPGMDYAFRRLRDGEPVRTVSGRLVKVAR